MQKCIIEYFEIFRSVIYFLPFTSGRFRGGSGGLLEPCSWTKLFQFHGEIYEKSGKMLKTNPLLVDLNPPFRNPGSATVLCGLKMQILKIIYCFVYKLGYINI